MASKKNIEIKKDKENDYIWRSDFKNLLYSKKVDMKYKTLKKLCDAYANFNGYIHKDFLKKEVIDTIKEYEQVFFLHQKKKPKKHTDKDRINYLQVSVWNNIVRNIEDYIQNKNLIIIEKDLNKDEMDERRDKKQELKTLFIYIK
ncbi:MAG: hypothetical protein ACRC4L_02860 [Mycoplasma sp.]